MIDRGVAELIVPSDGILEEGVSLGQYKKALECIMIRAQSIRQSKPSGRKRNLAAGESKAALTECELTQGR